MFEDIMGKKEYDRFDLACLCVIKTLNKMVDDGLMTGKIWEVTDSAEELIKDFKPTDEEIALIVALMKEDGYIE